MKVLFVSNDPGIFDSDSAVRARLRAYAEGLGELHVISAARADSTLVHEGPLHLYPVRVPRLVRVWALTRKAQAIIRAEGIELVSAQDPFEHGLAALRAVRGTSARLHVQVHTDFLSLWFLREGNLRSPKVRVPLLNKWRLRIADQVLPQAHGIRVVSERIKRSLLERYGSRIVEPVVLPIAVSAEVPEPVALPDRPFTFSLIAVGRLEPEKRVQDILAALKLVIAQYPMVGVVIVGEGRERRGLIKMARDLGLSDHVAFVRGWQPPQVAWGMMRSAQAFIQASAYEGFGRTIIEAALAKVPVITTDVGIVGEVFKGYEDVLSVPVADPTALSLAIVGLLEDTRVRVELVQHAEATARAYLANQGDLSARIVEDLRHCV